MTLGAHFTTNPTPNIAAKSKKAHSKTCRQCLSMKQRRPWHPGTIQAIQETQNAVDFSCATAMPLSATKLLDLLLLDLLRVPFDGTALGIATPCRYLSPQNQASRLYVPLRLSNMYMSPNKKWRYWLVHCISFETIKTKKHVYSYVYIYNSLFVIIYICIISITCRNSNVPKESWSLSQFGRPSATSRPSQMALEGNKPLKNATKLCPFGGISLF